MLALTGWELGGGGDSLTIIRCAVCKRKRGSWECHSFEAPLPSGGNSATEEIFPAESDALVAETVEEVLLEEVAALASEALADARQQEEDDEGEHLEEKGKVRDVLPQSTGDDNAAQSPESVHDEAAKSAAADPVTVKEESGGDYVGKKHRALQRGEDQDEEMEEDGSGSETVSESPLNAASEASPKEPERVPDTAETSKVPDVPESADGASNASESPESLTDDAPKVEIVAGSVAANVEESCENDVGTARVDESPDDGKTESDGGRQELTPSQENETFKEIQKNSAAFFERMQRRLEEDREREETEVREVEDSAEEGSAEEADDKGDPDPPPSSFMPRFDSFVAEGKSGVGEGTEEEEREEEREEEGYNSSRAKIAP